MSTPSPSTTLSAPAPAVLTVTGGAATPVATPAGPAHDPARRLTSEQLATLSPLLRSALAAIAVRRRHCTPFSALKDRLRTDAEDIRGVLRGPGTCTREQLEVVTTVVSARLSDLRDQRRRCENPRFRRALREEQARLQAVRDSLG